MVNVPATEQSDMILIILKALRTTGITPSPAYGLNWRGNDNYLSPLFRSDNHELSNQGASCRPYATQ